MRIVPYGTLSSSVWLAKPFLSDGRLDVLELPIVIGLPSVLDSIIRYQDVSSARTTQQDT